MTITFSDDICITNSIAKLEISSPLLSVFRKADYRLACFEAPINENNSKTFNKVGLTLPQHEDIAKISQLFTHVTIANNNHNRLGDTGLKDTFEYLQESNIGYAGVGHTLKNA